MPEVKPSLGANAHGVLSEIASGYGYHLQARVDLCSDSSMTPTWTDIMMWCCLAGKHEIARLIWGKTESPLRASLLASQMCRRLSRCDSLVADREALLKESETYEDMAIDLLDAVRDSEDALVLVALVPWEWGHEDNRPVRKMLWDESPFESASEEDGQSSMPCRRFVAHRHSQYLLNKFL